MERRKFLKCAAMTGCSLLLEGGLSTLLSAQKEPEKFRNLIVRVAGYSDYFNNFNKALQDEIISRTEHRSY